MAKKIKSRRINSPFLIGIFVIASVIVTLGVIFWLSAHEFLKEQTLYVTHFDGSIEGLEPGSAVKYQGVPVGTVKEVGVAPDGRLVEIVMQIDKKIEVNDSLRAKSEFAGIAGGKFIQLHYPSDPKMRQMHPKIDFKTKHPVIKSSPSGLDEIEIAMRDVMHEIKLLEFQKISNETLRFLQTSTEFFSNKEMYQTINNLKTASSHLAGIVQKADTMKTLDYIANTSSRLYQTSEELKIFANKLNDKVDSLRLDTYMKNAFSRYDTTMEHTQQVIESLGYRVESTLLGFSEVMEQIKNSNLQLQKTLRAISDNPSQMFLSEPPLPDE